MPERDVLSALLNRINRESENPLVGGMPLLSTWDAADRILASDWLAAHDREVAARTLESLAADLLDNPRTMWWSNFEGPMVQLDDATGEKVPFDEWLPARIAALRSGTDGAPTNG